MNTPRIGDIVHYVPHLGPDRDCLAALVYYASPDGQDTAVNVWTHGGDTYYAYPLPDPHGAITDRDGDTTPGPAGFTPGTWHPTH